MKDITKRSSAATMFSSHKSTQNQVRGAFIILINNKPFFSKQSVLEILESLVANGVTKFDIKLAPVTKTSSVRIWKKVDEY